MFINILSFIKALVLNCVKGDLRTKTPMLFFQLRQIVDPGTFSDDSMHSHWWLYKRFLFAYSFLVSRAFPACPTL